MPTKLIIYPRPFSGVKLPMAKKDAPEFSKLLISTVEIASRVAYSLIDRQKLILMEMLIEIPKIVIKTTRQSYSNQYSC